MYKILVDRIFVESHHHTQIIAVRTNWHIRSTSKIALLYAWYCQHIKLTYYEYHPSYTLTILEFDKSYISIYKLIKG